MSIFIPSVLFEDIRNKIGNVVFLTGRGGLAIRQLITPFNPKSTRQTTIRNIITTLSQAWRDTLTQVQRDAWESFASKNPDSNQLNSTITLSGIAAYMRSNIPLITMGLTRRDNAPADFSVIPAEVINPILSEAAQTVEFNYNPGPAATDYAYVKITNAHSPARNSVKSLLRWIGNGTQDLLAGAGTSNTPIPTWITPLVAGETRTIEVSFLNSLNGALSEPIKNKVTVVA